MKIIFYGNRQGNFFDKLIRWWTSPLKQMFNGEWRDSYSHCEILFSDGQMFSASQYENQVRFKRHSFSDNWTHIEVDCDEKVVRQFCTNLGTAKYDYIGILGFVAPLSLNSKSKWFCSEVCTAALQEVGEVEGLIPHTASPNRLYKELTNGI